MSPHESVVCFVCISDIRWIRENRITLNVSFFVSMNEMNLECTGKKKKHCFHERDPDRLSILK